MAEESEIRGLAGELVDRLIAVIAEGPEQDDEWTYSIALIFSRSVGGSLGLASMPGRPKAADEPGATLAKLRDRLMAVVGFGLQEDFLVRALRDVGTQWHLDRADVESGNEVRRASAAQLVEELDLVDVEDLEQVAAMADPLSPARAAMEQSRCDHWLDRASEFLSDDDLHVWEGRHMSRMLQPPDPD